MKLSGHARLKAALVLRDGLAAELGIVLPVALSHLRRVEESSGVVRALAESKFLDALGSISQGSSSLLAELNAEVRDACDRMAFSPRYAQYMALIMFAFWSRARQEDENALLGRLNYYLKSAESKDNDLSEFVSADLQLAAFWMATGAGKTHVLHACLAIQANRGPWDRVIIVTPSEALTRQHTAKLREVSPVPVFAYPMDGDATAIGYLPPQVVIVLDVNKLTSEKKGDGVTIGTSAFSDGRNLVFVDEGHKGQRSEASTWKALQSDLAGIDAVDPRHRGLLVEFSATFGQVVAAEHSFDRYAKAIVFDYAYDRFHQDRYGKDFWLARIQANDEASAVTERQTLTAGLLSYWYQLQCFQSSGAERLAAQLVVAPPLWVLLGLSVIGGHGRGDREQTSDVVDVLSFLHRVATDPAELANELRILLVERPGVAGFLPREVRDAAICFKTEDLARQVLAETFGWRNGDKLVLRVVEGAAGELGVGFLRGDTCHYFGVVNVGDAVGLKRALETTGLSVERDAISRSLFEQIDEPRSTINVLIGSRRFAEGWDNFRASSLTLLHLGQTEGSLIIQMFGRVVRFAGVCGDGKRLSAPSAKLAPLQTAYVYALKSRYLEAFLRALSSNGVSERRRVECEVRLDVPSLLRSVEAITPAMSDFHVSLKGHDWLTRVNKVRVSLTASVVTSELRDGEISPEQLTVGHDITDEFKRCAPLIDRSVIYHEMLEWRRSQGLCNVTFDVQAIENALRSDRFEIVGITGMLSVADAEGLARVTRVAATVMRRLFDSAYRKEESRQSRYSLMPALESGIPDRYYKECAP